MDPISAAQGRRFWAIALDEGWARPAVVRYLQSRGRTSVEEIDVREYDEMVADLYDEELRWKMGRDPNTPDLFD